MGNKESFWKAGVTKKRGSVVKYDLRRVGTSSSFNPDCPLRWWAPPSEIVACGPGNKGLRAVRVVCMGPQSHQGEKGQLDLGR